MFVFTVKYIVGCRGVVQLRGPAPGFAREDPTKVVLVSLSLVYSGPV